MERLSSMRKILIILFASLVLVSCASTRTTRVGAISEPSDIILDLPSSTFLSHGYLLGDWLGVEAENMLIRARVTEAPSSQYPTLVVSGEHVVLHIPADSVILGPFKNKNVSGNVHLGGTFVFTL
ncbi:MAG: hypothetical protein WC954_06120 [Sphaerochaeta sp.]